MLGVGSAFGRGKIGQLLGTGALDGGNALGGCLFNVGKIVKAGAGGVDGTLEKSLRRLETLFTEED